MMFLRTVLIVFVGITTFVQARPSPIPRVSFSLSNATSTTLLSASTLGRGDSAPTLGSLNPGKPFPPSPKSSSVCCFLVQDTISEEWWAEFSASTTVGLVTVTTVTTYLSKGTDGVGTVYSSSSSVEVVKTDFVFNVNIAVNPLATLYNPAPGPTEDDNALTGTATMTGGVLVQSPAAFYVYNSVKIITAAAVTDEDGHVMCGTTSNYPNINSNAEAYYAGPSLDGQNWSSSNVTTTITSTLTFIEPTVFTTTPTMTAVVTSYTTYYTNSAGNTVKPFPNQPGSVISLTTPFIWQPDWGSTGALTPSGHCKPGASSEQYGYIPQTLLNYLIKNPYYRSQYPGLESCLPGGPSLIFQICNQVTGTSQNGPLPSTVAIPAGGGLTSETTVYGLPDVGATPAPGGLGSMSALLTSPSNAWPNPTPNPDQSPAPTPNQNPTPPNSAHGLITTVLNPPPPGPGPGPFSTTLHSGTPVLLIPATTLPLSLAPPGLSGQTTIISSTPYLIIPHATSIPLPAPSNPANPLAISTTTINGVPYILVPSPSPSSPPEQELEGWLTTVSGGVGFVIADAMTVPVSEASELNVQGSGWTTVMGGSTEVVFSSGMTMMLGMSGDVSATTVTSLSSGKGAAATTVKSWGGRLESGLMVWAGVFAVVVLGLC